MSTMREDTTKIVLPRGGADDFWDAVHDHYANDSRQKWKQLAMLALHENAGWPLRYIGLAFSHRTGHVSRCLERIKTELRKRFRVSPLFLHREFDGLESGIDTDGDGAEK